MLVEEEGLLVAWAPSMVVMRVVDEARYRETDGYAEWLILDLMRLYAPLVACSDGGRLSVFDLREDGAIGGARPLFGPTAGWASAGPDMSWFRKDPALRSTHPTPLSFSTVDLTDELTIGAAERERVLARVLSGVKGFANPRIGSQRDIEVGSTWRTTLSHVFTGSVVGHLGGRDAGRGSRLYYGVGGMDRQMDAQANASADDSYEWALRTLSICAANSGVVVAW